MTEEGETTINNVYVKILSSTTRLKLILSFNKLLNVIKAKGH